MKWMNLFIAIQEVDDPEYNFIREEDHHRIHYRIFDEEAYGGNTIIQKLKDMFPQIWQTLS